MNAQDLPSSASKIAVIVLAGGSSSRLGKPKQLLQYQQQSLIKKITDTALQISPKVVVIVTGFLYEQLVNELKDYPVLIAHNPNWQEGIGSSIRAGISALEQFKNTEIDAVLFLLSDQPLIDAAHLKQLVSQFYADKRSIIAATTYAETQGVPAILDKNLFEDLKKLPGNRGAQWIFKLYPDQITTVPFEGAATDIDTPEDYENLLKKSDF